MVKFYEYFFYRLYWYYVVKGKEDIGNEVLSCAFGMSFFQGFNIVVLFDSVRYFIFNIRNSNVWYYWIMATMILICNYWYFSRKGRKERIINNWNNVTKRERLKMDVILIVYIVTTLLTTIWLAYMIRNNLKL